VKVSDVDELRQRIHESRLYGMNLTSVLLTRRSSIGSGARRTRLRAYVEAKGGDFEHKL